MKKFLALMLALTMLVGLTAIGASAEGGKTTVVFWNSWTGGDGEALQALVTKFNNSQDEVFIDMTRTTSFGDMLQTAMPTGTCRPTLSFHPWKKKKDCPSPKQSRPAYGNCMSQETAGQPSLS